MATTRTAKTATKAVKVATPTEDKPVEVVTKKAFKNDDLIPCRSVTNGELVMLGSKTGILYKWAGCDYVTDVEYQDLLYATRSRSGFVMTPRFIILDDDFVSQNKEVSNLYENLYTYGEINEILNLPLGKLKSVVSAMPEGIKNAVKGAVATAINAGNFDSVNKIKALDEIFGTSMLQVLVDK